MPYLRAVERAGGLPVVLPPLELDRIAPLLDRLSGVLLSGGPDLDPAAYGRAAHPELGPTEPQLDALRGAAGARGRRAWTADPRHLPRRAGAQHCARRHPPPAPPGDHGRLGRPPPAPAGRAGHARGPHRPRQWSRGGGRWPPHRRELLPPPERRAARRWPARGCVGRRRRHRGHRRAGRVTAARCSVARRDAGR